MAGRDGIEPSLAESKSAGLPLADPPVLCSSVLSILMYRKSRAASRVCVWPHADYTVRPDVMRHYWVDVT